MHNTEWAPNTMLKKLKSQFQENFQTEGPTDVIYTTLLATARGPVRE